MVIRGFLLGTNAAIVYLGSAIITPAEPIFVKIYGVSAEVSSLVLSMFVLGYVSSIPIDSSEKH